MRLSQHVRLLQHVRMNEPSPHTGSATWTTEGGYLGEGTKGTRSLTFASVCNAGPRQGAQGGVGHQPQQPDGWRWGRLRSHESWVGHQAWAKDTRCLCADVLGPLRSYSNV